MMNPVSNGFNCFQNGGSWMTGGGSWMMMGGISLFWIALIIGVVFIIKYVRNSNVSLGSIGFDRGDQSLQILNERFAKGEISVEEYEKLKAALMK